MLKNFLSKFQQLRQAHNDAKLNRQLVGEDRNGNKYFAYFDSEGYETKRECEYVVMFTNQHQQIIDPAWEEWLRRKRLNPYTAEEMAKIYKYTDNLRKQGLQSDDNEREMMRNYRKTDQYTKSDKKDFDPKSWDFG